MPRPIEAVCLAELRREALVRISGYSYEVDFGPDVLPRVHTVGKDRRCSCPLGSRCPAVQAVRDHLRAGGERAPDLPPGYFPSVPPSCPICGSRTYPIPALNSRQRGVGWGCTQSRLAHYWQATLAGLKQLTADNPWIYPPVIGRDGRVLYPGLRRDEISIRSSPWPEGYDPDR